MVLIKMDYLILFLFLSTLSVGFFLALKNKNIDVSKGLLTKELAQSDKYPFAAAIYVKTTTNTSFCGGTLLTNQWILTAGQCVYGAELFTIYLGSNDIEGDNPNRITVITTDYVLYPDFNPETLQHDVALIKLPMPIELNEYVRHADLPKRDVEIGATFITINWAQSSDQEPRVNANLLTVLSNTECTMTNYNRITQDMICLSGSYNEGICVGDTGSPLLEPVGMYYRHVGIRSFVRANGCQGTYLSTYTRTFYYLNWIRNVTHKS